MTSIVLAAGLSRRMGRNKLLLPFRGMSVIESTLKSVIPSSDRTIVVTGYDDSTLIPILENYDVDVIFNKDYEKGQKTSSILGIENTKDDDFAIIPGDLPLLSKDDINGVYSLLSSFDTARAFFGSTPGHPVAYRREMKNDVLSFDGTMKEFLMKKANGHFNASIGCIFDVDTPEKYSILLSNYQ